MIGFIYKTTCLTNGKIYIGKHEGDENDGYLGSGTVFEFALKKYGKENFKREILRRCKTLHELRIWEYVYIKKYHSQDKNIGYNIADGDVNTSEYNPAKLPEVKEKIRKATKKRMSISENNPMYGKHFSEETKKKMSDSQKGEKSWMWGRRGKLCHNFGRKLTTEQKEKLSILLSGKNNPRFGKKLTEEQKKKISEHHADMSGKNNPMWGKRGEKSPMYKRKWVNNGVNERFVSEIPEGYVLRRLKKRNNNRV